MLQEKTAYGILVVATDGGQFWKYLAALRHPVHYVRVTGKNVRGSDQGAQK